MSLFKKEESKSQYVKYGILAGCLEVLYISLLILSWNALISKYLSEIKGQDVLMPLLFLVAFVFSAAVSGLLVLGYPIYLFFVEKKIREAIATFVITLLILLVLGIIIFLLII